jgi:hypothetical protein
MKKSGLILAASLALSTAVFAQHEGAKHHSHTQTLKSKKLNALNFIKLTGGLGLSSYYGDICDGWDCYKLRHSLSAGAYFRYNNRFSFRADGFWTRLANDDETYKRHRNLGFRTDVFELSASTMFDIFPFEHKFGKRRAVEPYAHAGIGVVYFNPMGKLNDKWVSLNKYETEGKDYIKSSLVVPFGVGVRTRLRHDINIAGEFTYRLTFTDYLDDVSSKHYIEPSKFPGGATSEAALLSNRSDIPYFKERVRGNPKRNDGYFTFSVKVEYMIMAFSDLRSKGNLNRVPTGKKTIKRR